MYYFNFFMQNQLKEKVTDALFPLTRSMVKIKCPMIEANHENFRKNFLKNHPFSFLNTHEIHINTLTINLNVIRYS